MQKENIIKVIDNNILRHFEEGYTIHGIQELLNEKANKFMAILKDNDPDFVIIDFLFMDFEKITPFKTRYAVYYIRHALKRVRDLDWILSNKNKFPDKKYYDIFKLIKLRDRLSLSYIK